MTKRRNFLKTLALIASTGLASCTGVSQRMRLLDAAARETIKTHEYEKNLSKSAKEKAERLYKMVLEKGGKADVSSEGKLYSIEAIQYSSGKKGLKLYVADLNETQHSKSIKKITFTDGDDIFSLDGVVDDCSISASYEYDETVYAFKDSIYQPYIKNNYTSQYKLTNPEMINSVYLEHIEKILKIMEK